MLAATLRHVQGFPLLGLLWWLRCHIEYSEANLIALQLAFRFRQSTFVGIATIWHNRLSDMTSALYRLLRLRCDKFLLHNPFNVS